MTTSVLIVDDSKLARIVMGKTLAALQPEWRRLEAANAEEAIAVLDRETIDVLVLDYNMPGVNGLELAEQLRTSRPGMPIALATANIQDEVVDRARSADVEFIAKPVTEDGLRSFVTGAARRLGGAQ